jgi:hypothetical protein
LQGQNWVLSSSKCSGLWGPHVFLGPWAEHSSHLGSPVSGIPEWTCLKLAESAASPVLGQGAGGVGSLGWGSIALTHTYLFAAERSGQLQCLGFGDNSVSNPPAGVNSVFWLHLLSVFHVPVCHGITSLVREALGSSAWFYCVFCLC